MSIPLPFSKLSTYILASHHFVPHPHLVLASLFHLISSVTLVFLTSHPLHKLLLPSFTHLCTHYPASASISPPHPPLSISTSRLNHQPPRPYSPTSLTYASSIVFYLPLSQHHQHYLRISSLVYFFITCPSSDSPSFLTPHFHIIFQARILPITLLSISWFI